MKSKHTCICILTLLVVCNSCKKGFLDLSPQSQSTSSNFYKTTTDITNAVNGCYAALQSGNMYDDYFITMMETRSDNVEDINPGASAGRDYNIDRFVAPADNTAISGAWAALYNAISRCNNTLANLNVVTNSTLKAQYEGEVKFLRALHYFNIVRLWGDAPLVLKPVSTDDAGNLSRNTVSDIYGSIENDLNDAVKLLPVSYTSNTDIGRVTQGAAKALLGKVYLTEKKYQQCATVLKDLIPVSANPYGYKLLPNIADVFSVTNKMNAEIIFAVRYDKTIAGEGHGINVYFNPASGSSSMDPKLLSAYSATDTRRALLNTTTISASIKPINKYYDTYDPSNTTQIGNDFIILRYADVLLMYAEALNEIAYSSDIASDNYVYLNLIRKRANASLYTPAVLTDQATFRTAILLERRLEFPFELQRWFDLVRTNTAIDALKNSGLTSLSIQPYQFLYPIPQSEINIMNNTSGFPQNPGY